MHFDVVIVGASFAGLAAARTAASRGLSVAVLDAEIARQQPPLRPVGDGFDGRPFR